MRPGSYEEWVRLYDTISPADREALRAEEAQLGSRPKFSMVLPVYNPELGWLREAIESVQAQTYSHWELCVADDASTDPGVRLFLETLAKNDPRIRVTFRTTNGHISACSNSAIELATGEWCGLLDQDDVLNENALSLVAREINAHPNSGLVYSDEDFLDEMGARTNPFFKTDWNPELFLAQNYVNHFGVYRTSLLREIGGFREGFEGSQDYDLALRCIERLRAEQVRHIPRILYHWRMVPGSLAAKRDAKPYAKEAARRALADHMQRRGIAARVEPCPENIESHRVTFPVPEPPPLVSVILYTSGQNTRPNDGSRAIGERTEYPAREIIVTDDRSENLGARLNRAAKSAHGSVLVFVSDDVEVGERNWLDELVGQAMREEVGAVGVRLWSPDGTLRHGGFLLGVSGIADDAHHGVPRGHAGFFNRTFLQRNCSAVSVACLAVRASVFRLLGGFDDVNLSRDFQDIDFCLRAGERGLRIVWTSYVNPVAHGGEKKSRWAPDEDYMRKRWREKLPNDSFYSPNLSLDPPAFELAFPPRWAKR